MPERLREVGWSDRLDRYANLIERVERRRLTPAPRASVVVISWSPFPAVVEVCRFLEFQRSEGFELIFVDNGSASPIVDQLAPYTDVLVRVKANSGACTGRNLGAIFARAPVLRFVTVPRKLGSRVAK